MPLPSWDATKAAHGPFPVLLVGNGASRAVWSRFQYDQIYARALAARPPLLGDREIRHFGGERNFELVLSQMLVAERLSRQAGRLRSARYFHRRYRRIQAALAASLQAVHVPFATLQGTGVLEQIGTAISEYDHVFSTNYDVLLYWAILLANESMGYNHFKDYFFSRDDDETVRFSVGDSQIWPDRGRERVVGVSYLHGALHLVRTADGETHKLCRREGQYLLDRFGEEILDGASPLVVTEGTSAGKLKSIDRSGYLTFALSQLSETRGNVVVFGHSLSAQDAHIAKAIKWDREVDRTIAIGMRPSADDERIGGQQLRLRAALHSRLRVVFFDASTHPLGSEGLRVG